jgi:hypothetical protein
MEGEDRFWSRIVEDTLSYHRLSPLNIFFGRLEDELDGPWYLVADRYEGFGERETDGCMNVVTANMADSWCLGCEWNGIWCIGLNRIHVGPKGDDTSRFATSKNTDDTMPADLGLHLEIQRLQPRSDNSGGALLLS